MAFVKTRLKRYNGTTWDTVYIESDSSIILRPNGSSIESALVQNSEDINTINDTITEMKAEYWYEDL